MISLAPIVLFTYKRLDTLKECITRLQKNIYATETDLHIFSDAASNNKDALLVENVRAFIKTIQGFNSINAYFSKENKGLAASVINGVTQIINQYNKVIVIEDDLITSTNFLSFINQALDFYQYNNEVISIAGYSPVIKNPTADVYFTQRASSWGWATWKDRWMLVDWKMSSYKEEELKSSFKRNFNRMGSDMYKMLNDQFKGKINSWAIKFCYHQYITKKYTVFPSVSKVQNIGIDASATHTRNMHKRFWTNLDTSGQSQFNFPDSPFLDKKYLKQFLQPYSLPIRIKYKLLSLLPA